MSIQASTPQPCLGTIHKNSEDQDISSTPKSSQVVGMYRKWLERDDTDLSQASTEAGRLLAHADHAPAAACVGMHTVMELITSTGPGPTCQEMSGQNIVSIKKGM